MFYAISGSYRGLVLNLPNSSLLLLRVQSPFPPLIYSSVTTTHVRARRRGPDHHSLPPYDLMNPAAQYEMTYRGAAVQRGRILITRRCS
jgi:hypothetical protein